MKIEHVAAQLYTVRDFIKTPPDIAAAMKRIRGRRGSDRALVAVDESNANAKCAEVNAGDDGHGKKALRVNAFSCAHQSTPFQWSVVSFQWSVFRY